MQVGLYEKAKRLLQGALDIRTALFHQDQQEKMKKKNSRQSDNGSIEG